MNVLPMYAKKIIEITDLGRGDRPLGEITDLVLSFYRDHRPLAKIFDLAL